MNRSSLLAPCLLFGTLLLAGCQGTMFEKSPLAETGCNPALAGTWLSQDEDPDDVGEVVLKVDARCRVEVEEHEARGIKRGDAVQVRLGRHGTHDYLWVDARWAHKRFEEDHVPPAGDVYLLRYALQGDELSIWSTDDKPIAHDIIDNELTGEVISRDNRLFNRLTGEPGPDVLDRASLFKADAARFRRQAPAAP